MKYFMGLVGLYVGGIFGRLKNRLHIFSILLSVTNKGLFPPLWLRTNPSVSLLLLYALVLFEVALNFHQCHMR